MKILVSDSITENGLSVLKDANLDVLYLPNASIKKKSEAAKEIYGWIIRSGTTITEKMITTVRKSVDIPLIIGGGIRNGEKAISNCNAGADIIVVGNSIERDENLISEIANAIHSL